MTDKKKYDQKCACCEKDYKWDENHMNSNEPEKYCLYLGCCCYECFRDLTPYQRNILSVSQFIHNEKYRNSLME